MKISFWRASQGPEPKTVIHVDNASQGLDLLEHIKSVVEMYERNAYEDLTFKLDDGDDLMYGQIWNALNFMWLN